MQSTGRDRTVFLTERNASGSFSASFKSVTPRIPALATNQRVPYRTSEVCQSDIAAVVRKSPIRFSGMTAERSSPERYKVEKSEAHEVAFYDIGKSGALADLSVLVEQSPIRFASFKAARHRPLANVLRAKSAHLPEPATEPSHRPTTESQLRTPVRSPKSPASYPHRFPAAGHPFSMFPAPVCHNEMSDAYTGTIAAYLDSSPCRYSVMSSRSGRSTAVDQTFGLTLQCPGLKPKRWLPVSEAYDGVATALPAAQQPISAHVENNPLRYSAFSSTVERIPAPRCSLDLSVPLKHEVRRQHLLQSRIIAIRGPSVTVSKKLKGILNLA